MHFDRMGNPPHVYWIGLLVENRIYYLLFFLYVHSIKPNIPKPIFWDFMLGMVVTVMA